MKNISMDSQMLSSLMVCPTKFNRTFNLNLTSVKGKPPALGTGSLVHTITEWFAKARIDNKSYSESVDIGFIAGREYVKPYHELNKYIKDVNHPGIENVPATSDNGKIISVADVFSTMQQYFDYWKNDTNTILEAEVVKKRVIYEDSDIRILWNGKIDRVIDTPLSIMPMDHKTYKQKRDTLSLNNQFIGYCHLIGCRMVMIDKIGFQKTVPINEKFIRMPISYSLSRLEEWRTETLVHYASMYAAFMEANNWPMDFSGCETKYGMCAFYDICETDASVRDEVMMTQFKVGKKWDVMSDD